MNALETTPTRTARRRRTLVAIAGQAAVFAVLAAAVALSNPAVRSADEAGSGRSASLAASPV